MADELNKLAKEYFEGWQNLPIRCEKSEIPKDKLKYYRLIGEDFYQRKNIEEYNYFVQECQLPGFKS